MGASACCGTKSEAFLPVNNESHSQLPSNFQFSEDLEEEKESWTPERLKFLFSEELFDNVDEGNSIKKLLLSRIFSHREEVQYTSFILDKIDSYIERMKQFKAQDFNAYESNTILLISKSSNIIRTKYEESTISKKEHERTKADRSKIRFLFGKAAEHYINTKIYFNNLKNKHLGSLSPNKINSPQKKKLIDVIFLEEFINKIV